MVEVLVLLDSVESTSPSCSYPGRDSNQALRPTLRMTLRPPQRFDYAEIIDTPRGWLLDFGYRCLRLSDRTDGRKRPLLPDREVLKPRGPGISYLISNVLNSSRAENPSDSMSGWDELSNASCSVANACLPTIEVLQRISLAFALASLPRYPLRLQDPKKMEIRHPETPQPLAVVINIVSLSERLNPLGPRLKTSGQPTWIRLDSMVSACLDPCGHFSETGLCSDEFRFWGLVL